MFNWCLYWLKASPSHTRNCCPTKNYLFFNTSIIYSCINPILTVYKNVPYHFQREIEVKPEPLDVYRFEAAVSSGSDHSKGFFRGRNGTVTTIQPQKGWSSAAWPAALSLSHANSGHKGTTMTRRQGHLQGRMFYN